MAVITYATEGEWLEARRHVLTATQAAIVWSAHCGEKLWDDATPFTVWQEKVGEAEPFQQNVHTWLGHALERPLCQWAADKLGGTLEYPPPYTLEIRDDAPWMACTPDARVRVGDDVFLIQSKTASWVDDWGPSGPPTGGAWVPFTYLSQCYWEMAVTNTNVNYLAVFLAYAEKGWKRPKVVKDRRIYPLVRNSMVEHMMVGVCQQFWERYVVTGFPPPKTYKQGGE